MKNDDKGSLDDKLGQVGNDFDLQLKECGIREIKPPEMYILEELQRTKDPRRSIASGSIVYEPKLSENYKG